MSFTSLADVFVFELPCKGSGFKPQTLSVLQGHLHFQLCWPSKSHDKSYLPGYVSGRVHQFHASRTVDNLLVLLITNPKP